MLKQVSAVDTRETHTQRMHVLTNAREIEKSLAPHILAVPLALAEVFGPVDRLLFCHPAVLLRDLSDDLANVPRHVLRITTHVPVMQASTR